MTMGTEQSRLPEIPSFRERVASFALLFGTGILVHVFSILTAAAVLFALGQAVDGVAFAVGSLGAAAFLWWGASEYFGTARFGVFVCVMLGIAGLFLGLMYLVGGFYDVSYDGQRYHQETILQLAGGWNPFRRELTSAMVSESHIREVMTGYARGAEVVAAGLYRITGHMEQCKVFNLQLIVASFCVTLCALLRWKQLRPAVAVLLSALAALNPVSVYQSFSFYVEGQLSSVLVCLLSLGLILFQDRSAVVLVSWGSAIATAVNLKFTGVVYAGILVGGFLVGFLILRNRRAAVAAGTSALLASVLGICFLGYGPYAVNTVRRGHPFYPLNSADLVNYVLAIDGPENFRGLNRLETLFVSVFSRTEDVYSVGPNKRSHFKWPFTVSRREWEAVRVSSDVRIGGWGPLFGGAVIIALVILIMALPSTPGKTGLALGMVAVVFLSGIATPAAWRARWFPQLWVVPIVAALLSQYVPRRIPKFLGWALILLLVINVGFISTAYVYYQSSLTKALGEQLSSLSGTAGPVVVYFGRFRSNRIRFEELGIPYREVREEKDLPDVSRAERILCSTVEFCREEKRGQQRGLQGSRSLFSSWSA